MKKILSLSFCALALMPLRAQNQSQEPDMTKSKGVYVINTTKLCNTIGYKDTTPLVVRIKKDVIQSVEALPNKETPRFFKRVVDEMLPKYKDVKFKAYESVDGVTGSTKSSLAVKAHMKAAFEYYKKNK